MSLGDEVRPGQCIQNSLRGWDSFTYLILLPFHFIHAFHVEGRCVRTGDDVVEKLESDLLVRFRLIEKLSEKKIGDIRR